MGRNKDLVSEQNKIENIQKNLMVQIDKILDSTNEKGIKTRYRYFEATKRFCGFLAEEYKLQKFQNVKAKHLIAYVRYMQNKGYAASTIKNELAGIRFYHERSGSKNILPTNDRLNLEKRAYGQIDRAWNENEISQAKNMALNMGRSDIYHAINMGCVFGMRLEEVVRCQVNHLKNAVDTGELYIKGKNGQVRHLHFHCQEQYQVAKGVIQYAKENGRGGTDKVLIDGVKGATLLEKRSVQNWMVNHREKFQDNSREWKDALDQLKEKAKQSGVKVKTENVTFHGLRYHYAQGRFDDYTRQGCSELQARKNVAEELGHHRDAVTKVYLSKQSSKYAS